LLPSSAVTIFSGGTEGVLSPHITFIVKEKSDTGLLAAVGRTRDLEPHEIGTLVHAGLVREVVSSMLEELGVVNPGQVFVKCPLLTSAKLQAIRDTGKSPVTEDTYESMAKSRYASACGVALATGFMEEYELDGFSSGEGWSIHASCSSGAELEDCHVLMLANSSSRGPLRIISTVMQDAIDARAITNLLREVQHENGVVIQAFAKAEADPKGLIRGSRHTMNTDSDIHSTRHARAAVGGLLAGLIGDTQVYVSGGAEGQGKPGGGCLCIVYKHDMSNMEDPR
jgi:cyanuric acid amidohydrolase